METLFHPKATIHDTNCIYSREQGGYRISCPLYNMHCTWIILLLAKMNRKGQKIMVLKPVWMWILNDLSKFNPTFTHYYHQCNCRFNQSHHSSKNNKQFRTSTIAIGFMAYTMHLCLFMYSGALLFSRCRFCKGFGFFLLFSHSIENHYSFVWFSSYHNRIYVRLLDSINKWMNLRMMRVFGILINSRH